MQDQPVIRINCNTGERTNYPNIASAAKAVKISPPGLRNRILTDVHVNNFHWVFDKNAGYTSTLSIDSEFFQRKPTANFLPRSLTGFSEIGI